MSWAWAAILPSPATLGGGTLSPLLGGGKSMGENLGRRENMVSPVTRRKLVGVVLSEAEYIILTPQ